MDVRDKTAVVTGAGSGVGRELALSFARGGANVVCCGRREYRLVETVAAIEKEGYAILAFCMMPGLVRTEMTEYLVDTPEKMKWQKHVVELRGTPSDDA